MRQNWPVDFSKNFFYSQLLRFSLASSLQHILSHCAFPNCFSFNESTGCQVVESGGGGLESFQMDASAVHWSSKGWIPIYNNVSSEHAKLFGFCFVTFTWQHIKNKNVRLHRNNSKTGSDVAGVFGTVFDLKWHTYMLRAACVLRTHTFILTDGKAVLIIENFKCKNTKSHKNMDLKSYSGGIP